jgi:hypothetical protein
LRAETSQEWFSEPTGTDDTYRRREEPTTDWLKRSTIPRARGCRRFLNENLSSLPSGYQRVLYRALHDRWHSAFFELIVARTLQVLGAEIEVEPGSAAGTRIDFMARFSDETVSVEAVAPVFNADAGETAARRIPLLEIVEALAPAGWRVMVVELPDLGPGDSKRQFKKTVEELLETEPPESWSEPKSLIAELPSGDVHLRLLPKRDLGAPEGPTVVTEPALSAFDNSEQRIRRAIKRKRRQGRNVATPAILAVHATGISSEFEDFDLALYGREIAFADPDTYQIVGTRFQADGVFNRGGVEPTFAAVIAFVNVNFPGGPDPVLYLHPRFQGDLPEALMSIEHRSYDAHAETVIVRPSRKTGFLKQLGFVSV